MTPRTLARLRWTSFLTGCLLGLALWAAVACLIVDAMLSFYVGP